MNIFVFPRILLFFVFFISISSSKLSIFKDFFFCFAQKDKNSRFYAI